MRRKLYHHCKVFAGPGSLLLVVLLCCGRMSVHAQIDSIRTPGFTDTAEEEKPERSIRVSLTPGLTARISPGFDPDSSVDSKTGGPGAILGFTLVPEHALRVGLESGFISITNVVESQTVSTIPQRYVLTAIPIFMTLAVGNENIEVGGGIGYYSLIASAGAQDVGTSFKSYDWEIGFMLNASYVFPLRENFDLGPDLRVYNFTDRPLTVILLGASLRMKMLDL